MADKFLQTGACAGGRGEYEREKSTMGENGEVGKKHCGKW